MVEVELSGCSVQPLGSYLKALGVLRLVGQQSDRAACGYWRNDQFVLASSLSADELVKFVVARYRPTPIITPWNSGSGFGTDDASKSPAAFNAAQTLADSSDPRLAVYRSAIAVARALASRSDWAAAGKQGQVTLCRNELPDETVDWIDAAVVLTADSRAFPPLLGTGGNDGRLDFGSNVMQRLVDLFRLGPKPRSERDVETLARAALFGTDAALDRAGLGQFDPSGGGGPNSAAAGSAVALSNPWDFVLAFEGAVMFASGVARRLGQASGSAAVTAVPFTVQAAPVAYASAASENTRGEFWAPIWHRPTSSTELQRMIGESRAQYRGRQARNGTDFVRALSTFGVDRGIDEFVRFGFLERNGLATMCVPIGRFRPRSVARAEVLGQLDRWLGRVRRVANRPASADALLRAIDTLQFSIGATDSAAELQALLANVGTLERLAVRNAALRDATGEPVVGVRAGDWVRLLDDGSPEFRVAVAVASLRRPGAAAGFVKRAVLDTRWGGRPSSVGGFGVRSLLDVLADVLVVMSRDKVPDPDGGERRGWVGPCVGAPVDGRTFELFCTHRLSARRIGELLGGLLTLDWADYTPIVWQESPGPALLPAAFAAIKPLFHHRGERSLSRPEQILSDATIPRLLAVDSVRSALYRAVRELRVEGFSPALGNTTAAAVNQYGPHIASAALIPITDRYSSAVLKVARRVDDTNSALPESECT